MKKTKLSYVLRRLNQFKWVEHLNSVATVYMVGGCVRDCFLDKPIKDVDLVIEDLSMDKIKDILSQYGKVDIVGESFSVIKFKMKNINQGLACSIGTEWELEDFDIAVPRMDKKIGEGHKGFEILTDGVDILSDLKRRDFTINSIAVNTKTYEIIDPFNGQEDIKTLTLKATDEQSFIDDPLRILRGIQFASRFNLKIELNTLDLMRLHSNMVKTISGERIFEELNKIIKKQGNVGYAIKLLNKSFLSKTIFGNEFDIFNIDEYNVNLNDLDYPSFFYVLCKGCGVNPAIFVKEKLKATNELVRDLQIIDKLLNLSPTMLEEERRLEVSKAATRTELNFKILPMGIVYIVELMNNKMIPVSFADINIDGTEIMDLLNINGAEIGMVITQLTKDALMNKFNWNNKEECIKYLIQNFKK